MTIENLLSGLIGALVGALIVVRAEQWRWRRENRAAARLVYYEVMTNRVWLNTIAKSPEVVKLITMLSQSVWESERVRVASLVKGDLLNKVAAANFTLTNLLATRPLVGDKAWMESLTSDDGKKRVAEALRLLDESTVILKQAMDERTWAERRWQATQQWMAQRWKAAALRARTLLK